MIKKLALILALLSIGACAQLQRYDSTATAVTGQPGSIQLQAVLPGSKIYACTGSAQPCAAPGTAALYSDIAGTVPLPQPLVADANGKFGFYWNGATITWTATPPPGLIGSVQSETVTSPLAAQQISVSTPQPAAPSSVTVSPVGTTGGTTYYYWVVSNFTIGNSAPSLSAVITNAAATLSTINYDKVAWTAVTGANTYDVLRTTSTTAPTGACACAVATAVNALTANDQSNALSAYTVNTYAGNTTFNITNVATGTGASALTFTADHGTAFSVTNTGGLTFTSPAITPTSIESVLYSDQFPGGDAGARLAAALASLSSGGTGNGLIWAGNEAVPVWSHNPFAGLDNFVGRVELGAAVVSLDHQITIPQGLVLEGIGASGSFGSVLRAGASFVGSCSITSAARASNVDTFDTSTSCNLEVGDIVRPVGVSDTTFNVPLEVATVGTNTFTAAQTASNSTSSGGTVYVPLVELGNPGAYGSANAASDGQQLRDLMVDCDNVAGCVGVYSGVADELSGMWRDYVINYTQAGVWFDNTSQGESANYRLEDLYLLRGNSGTPVDLLLDGGSQSERGVDNITAALGPSGHTTTDCIQVNAAYGLFTRIHVEGCTNGVHIAATDDTGNERWTGVFGNSNVGTTFLIDGAHLTSSIVLNNVSLNGGGTLISDPARSFSTNDAHLAEYMVPSNGGGYISPDAGAAAVYNRPLQATQVVAGESAPVTDPDFSALIATQGGGGWLLDSQASSSSRRWCMRNDTYAPGDFTLATEATKGSGCDVPRIEVDAGGTLWMGNATTPAGGIVTPFIDLASSASNRGRLQGAFTAFRTFSLPDASGTVALAGANGISAGLVTLAAGAGSHTFATAYASAPVCVATDTTTAAAVKATSSTTAVALAGTGTDVIAWSCSPAVN